MKYNYKFILVAAFLLVSPVVFAQANLLVNGSFESNDLSGWTAVNSGSGIIAVYTGSIASNSGMIPAPTDGTYASLVSQDGPGSHILYQDIFIPPGTAAAFSTQLFYRNSAGAWYDNGTLSETGDANQHMRIDIMDPAAPVDDVGAGVLLNVFKTEGLDPFEFGYGLIEADLTPFAGQTVRVRFAEVDNQFFFDVAFDDVQVLNSGSWAIPVNNPIALLLLIAAMLMIAGLVIRRSKTQV